MYKLTHFAFSALLLLIYAAPEINCDEYNDIFLQKVLQIIRGPFDTKIVGDDILVSNYTSTVVRAADDDDDNFGFPDIFTSDQLRQGWVVLHVLGAIYFFVLLSIVCNDYFLPTVECICNDLNLPKDVAAATFMATATTMPEFFTNTISTFITNDDMGLGTILGSLMFNTLGVAGAAALAINKPVQLDWWPILRDCVIYTLNTIILLVLAWGGYVTFVDTCIMMGFLVIYYILTFNNSRFMPAIRVFVEDKLNCCFSTRYDFTEPPENSAKAKLPLKKDPLNGDGIFVVNLPESDNNSIMSSTVNLTQSKSWLADNESVELPAKLFSLPHSETKLIKFWWCFTFPIRFVLAIIIPNPITCRKLYPLSFIMCIITIGCNAYMIVWMLTALGIAIRVPTVVMGMTFLAAGSNMPEAISSIYALRSGESGIGVSNSLGANSLAILLSLGVPWFIKNIMNLNNPEFVMKIGDSDIQYNIIILLLCTFALFFVLSMSGYRLTKRAGIAMFTVYIILIALQILIQMKIINLTFS